PSYVAKATWGVVPVEADGSAHFRAPAGKVLYFQALDEEFNELQRMRSVVQLQPGEKRSCIGCHEDRRSAPAVRQATALRREPSELQPPPWGAGPFSYEEVVQPVWDAHCVRCHDAADKQRIDLSGTLDADKVPASYRTLISQGWVHYLDWGYNSGGNEKRRPLTFGTVKSKLWEVLDAGHYEVKLSSEEMRRVKCWIDLNCPLWPDYIFRGDRPGPTAGLSRK
ncbi:MAG: HzsA-related protein, partial [Planctomycetota bacterium]